MSFLSIVILILLAPVAWPLYIILGPFWFIGYLLGDHSKVTKERRLRREIRELKEVISEDRVHRVQLPPPPTHPTQKSDSG